MTWEVQLLSAILLGIGIYVRGAIVRGALHHTDALLFGPALVDAHEIEQRVAKYPRIVVTAMAAPFVVSAINPSLPAQAAEPQWSRDSDGLMFLEIFKRRADGTREDFYQGLARAARDVVQGHLLVDQLEGHKDTEQMNHQAKYGWMLHYLEGVIAAKAAEQETGEESADGRLATDDSPPSPGG
jgi:hypothetical protein